MQVMERTTGNIVGADLALHNRGMRAFRQAHSEVDTAGATVRPVAVAQRRRNRGLTPEVALNTTYLYLASAAADRTGGRARHLTQDINRERLVPARPVNLRRFSRN